MKSIKESELAAYIQAYLARNKDYKKAIYRHFQGTIVSVALTNGTNLPWLCTVNRTEGQDSNAYVCAIPGYIPQVGDVVECEWRDGTSGYIKYPLKTVYPAGTNIFKQIITTAAQVNPTISAIPAIGRALRLTFTARDTSGGASFANLPLQFNLDGSGLYDDQIILITGSTVTGTELASQTSIRIGTITQGAATAGTISSGVVEIPNYADSVNFKQCTCVCAETHIVGTGVNVTHVTKGQYRSTLPISSITLVATFAAGCILTLQII